MSTQHPNTKWHRRRYYEKHRVEILAKTRALRKCPEWNKREVERKRAYYLKHRTKRLEKMKKEREVRSAQQVEADKQRYRKYKRENREKVRATLDKRREYHNQKARERYAKKRESSLVKQNGGKKGKLETEIKIGDAGRESVSFTSERDVLADLFPDVLPIFEEKEPSGTVFQIL